LHDFRVRTPSATTRALIGLTLGLVVGVGIVWADSASGRTFAAVVEPVGTLWVNALRMTVVPLVVSLLIATLGSRDGAAMFSRLGQRAIVTFIVFLVVIAAIGLLLAPPVYSLLHVDEASAAALRASAGQSLSTALPTFGSWVAALVPPNVMKAAADGAMLPLIVFAVIFGLALARLEGQVRAAAVDLFRAIADGMGVIVRWILLAAPVGAFALAVTVATHLGNATAHVILFYLVSHAALLVVVGALLYVVIPLVTGTPVRRFARALVPAQVVVVSTRSSLAALPAMLEGSTRILGIPDAVAGVVLPLAVSLLRASTGLSWVVYALFLSKLYGVPLGLAQLVGVAAVSIAMSFSVPGIPSGGLLIATPYFSAVGLPPQGIGILIALDAIPDIFKTLVIVQCDVAVTLLLARDPVIAASQPPRNTK
jgi:Na+/H+-dicarboxylate symporter